VNLDRLREWLISQGIDAEELDEFVETRLIKDIGEGLALSLMNDENLGLDVFMLMLRMDEMETRMEQRLKALEGSGV
jgi:hypothetical protein